MDLGAGHEADRECSGAQTVTDETFVTPEGEGTAEYSGIAYDTVFAEKGEFQISGKVDLTAVKVSGQHVIERQGSFLFFRKIRKCVKKIRIMYQKKAESFVVFEFFRHVDP